MNYDELKNEIDKIKRLDLESKIELSEINKNIERKIYIAENTGDKLDELELEFEKLTGLDSLDVRFLFLATALQCARQYLLTNDKGRFETDQKASKVLKKFTPIKLLGPVPYDAFKKSNYDENTGISGRNHRYTTLGHDPLLGWIFGPINILTETVTKNNIYLESYSTVLIGNEYKISSSTNIVSIVNLAIQRYKENPDDLTYSVLKHAIHFASDAFTKMGLPVPIMNNLVPDLMPKLMDNGIDFYSVSRGIALSSMINSIISVIHGMYFEADSKVTRELFLVKTRKIIMYSNIIASTSNVIVTAFLSSVGDSKALTKLDVGGIIVTIHRIMNDMEFIGKIKQEFVYEKYNQLLLE